MYSDVSDDCINSPIDWKMETEMPTLQQKVISSLTRLYPFYSGCATFANSLLVQKLAGQSAENVWSTVPGGEILGSLSDYVGRAAYYVGDIDRKLTWISAQIVRPGDTVLDIGANIGIVTLWLAKLVGASGRVHAFEPNPNLQKLLGESLSRNHISNVVLHRIALGTEQGLLELRVPRFNFGMGSLVAHRDSIECDVFHVPVQPLSVIVNEENIKAIRLMKIDVEGFEAQVLQGSKEVLEFIRPEAILFEINTRKELLLRDEPVFRILCNYGYKFFSIPKCIFRMHLERIDLDSSNQQASHDILAVLEGESYEKIAKLVKAS